MTPDIIERRFRHCITIADRVIGGTLHVHIVIWAADRGADHADSAGFEHVDELNGFFQIRIHVHSGSVSAERVGIADSFRPFHRMPDAVRAFDEREDVEQAYACGDVESGNVF